MMMKQTVAAAMVLAAAGAGSAVAQTPTYTFEMRLIPDGAVGAPSGPWAMYPLPANYGGAATRIGSGCRLAWPRWEVRTGGSPAHRGRSAWLEVRRSSRSLRGASTGRVL